VETELHGYTGKIIFDLTLINGTNSNRYLEVEVVSGEINRKSFKIKRKLDEPIGDVSRNFFRNNVEVLEKSTITNALKFLLKTGQRV
jgi:polyisoprenoid-binding protein YceI